ncbi:MAG: hypothetical protein ACRD2J_12395 [Thermoanaerobaculia bacterium]
MKQAAVALALLALACASGDVGRTVNANEGGVPFALAGAGFPEEIDAFPPWGTVSVPLRFVFTNVSDRAYTVEQLTVRQATRGMKRLQFAPAFETVDRTVESGEDLDVEVTIHIGPGEMVAGESINAPLGVDAFLTTSDGTRYRYSIGIPIL